jgi:xylulokinase
MSLLGIDVGTTGCKAAAFSEDGHLLALHYEGYQIQKPQPGWAQLDSLEVWQKVKLAIRTVAAQCEQDTIHALSVSSLGEAVVPVTESREVLGPSILNFDQRGDEFLAPLGEKLRDEKLYSINGNTLGNQYGLTKLIWIKTHQPELYQSADKFLLWSSFIAYMLGAEPVTDYSLANRTLLFDLDQCDWSAELLGIAGLDGAKLPDTAPSGTEIGRVAEHLSEELNLPQDVIITSGAHDQNAAAVGCGVIDSGRAVYGMGTFICITPVFNRRLAADTMITNGLNTEHHAVPGKYVCFIYNQGGSIVKWFRDTFSDDRDGDQAYNLLFSELPQEPSNVVVLPHFTLTGPPHFASNSSGVMVGLDLETSRGDLLKGILEGVTFSLKEVVDSLVETGIGIHEYRPVGGGSKSQAWIQTSADILGKPFKLPMVKEAGTLGAAIIAGVGSNIYTSFEDGVEATVKVARTFEPDMNLHQRYQANYQAYKELWLLMGDYLQDLAKVKPWDQTIGE